MNKPRHIALNIRCTFVLDGIICFSVRFCDNLLLVLKMRFQVFSLASKKVEGFPSDRKILMSLLFVLFHLQKRVSVFWNFNFWSGYLGKRLLCSWNQSHFLRKSDCRFSRAGNWELLKSIVGQNLEEAMFVYILKREIGYAS